MVAQHNQQGRKTYTYYSGDNCFLHFFGSASKPDGKKAKAEAYDDKIVVGNALNYVIGNCWAAG